MFSVKQWIADEHIRWIKKRMDKGLFVIVPYANDESKTEVREWHLSQGTSFGQGP